MKVPVYIKDDGTLTLQAKSKRTVVAMQGGYPNGYETEQVKHKLVGYLQAGKS